MYQTRHIIEIHYFARTLLTWFPRRWTIHLLGCCSPFIPIEYIILSRYVTSTSYTYCLTTDSGRPDIFFSSATELLSFQVMCPRCDWSYIVCILSCLCYYVTSTIPPSRNQNRHLPYIKKRVRYVTWKSVHVWSFVFRVGESQTSCTKPSKYLV